jgi:uncharacterized protein (TIGR02217 family)
MVPSISSFAFAQSLSFASPTLAMECSEGDYLIAIAHTALGGGLPQLSLAGGDPSSSWTTIFTADSAAVFYRRATADEVDVSYKFVFPSGLGGANWSSMSAVILRISGAVRIDTTYSAPGSGAAAVLTLDGYTLSGLGQYPSPAQFAALAVLFSSDGFPLPIGVLFPKTDEEFDLSPAHIPDGFRFALPYSTYNDIFFHGATGFDPIWGTVLTGASKIIEFPRSIDYKAIAGDSYATEITAGGGGAELRRSKRTDPRKQWQVSLRTPAGFSSRQEFIDLLLAFFLTRAGKAYTFRLRDPVDYLAQNEELVVISSGVYQLVKRYQVGGRTYIRNIYKPITAEVTDWQGNALGNTVALFSNGTPVDPANYTVDTETGQVTTAAGATLTASFEFDFPARFDTDEFSIQIEDSFVSGDEIVASVNSLPLIEVLSPTF